MSIASYDRAIEILATQSANLALDGAQSDTPSGVGLVMKLFDKTSAEVENAYKPRAHEIACEMLARARAGKRSAKRS